MILDLHIVRWDRMWHRVVKVCTIKWHMLLKMNDGSLALVSCGQTTIFFLAPTKRKNSGLATWD